jgi:hypothetical protein
MKPVIPRPFSLGAIDSRLTFWVAIIPVRLGINATLVEERNRRGTEVDYIIPQHAAYFWT